MILGEAVGKEGEWREEEKERDREHCGIMVFMILIESLF